ncbi:hypothetical protein WOLCODRAFT_25099 [Wolfiporia cocos MD-104 SS10]|uniref:Uncharacterized protein n=1 Tax=Wolfiporia cocos (strain MD-104) TaxID=742152 RepID=A0A2H3K0W4_WOLCO|nr:hypothetical protein WOLCODRAFT_25099 [Wolfiporia cocos MD-104 SS10]
MPRQEDPAPMIDRDKLQRAAWDGASTTTEYCYDVMSTALRLLRKPLGFLLFVWILGVLFRQLTHTFRLVLSPFCIIPGISSSPLCYTPPREDKSPQWANYTRLVDLQSSTFEQLLDESASGSGLSLEMKKAQLATRDLITLVRVSSLTGRDVLAEKLSNFVDDAKTVGRGLSTMSSRIGGAVDSIMAVNDYAIHTIEAANVGSSALSIIWPFTDPHSTHMKEVVVETFNSAMGVLTSQIERLILEAEANLTGLDRLEEHLSTIHEIISREDNSITKVQEELLSALWTKLGGNQREVRKNNKHLVLLRNLGTYRGRALAHVAAALQTLQQLSTDMEDLRDRVSAPEILGDRIPIEVHMKSIRGGIDRLKEGQQKAREREAVVVRRILGIEGGDTE